MTAKQRSTSVFLTILSLLCVAQSALAQPARTDPYDAAGKVGALIGGIVGAFFLVRSFRKKK